MTNKSLSLPVVQIGYDLADGHWHQVRFMYGLSEFIIGIDYIWPDTIKQHVNVAPPLTFEADSELVIGIGAFDTDPGPHTFTILNLNLN